VTGTGGGAPTEFGSPEQVARRLADVGYVSNPHIDQLVFLASRLHRPMFLEGHPGSGKTYLATALAEATGRQPYRVQCFAGVDASAALFEWDFAAQVLYLRSLQQHSAVADGDDESIYSRRFLEARPIMRAVENPHSVLLIDEVDRADEAFEAVLLEFLSDYSITVPHLGTVCSPSPATHPIVVLTSNRTRDVHDALKRRCLYHYFEHPNLDQQTAVLASQLPELRVERAQSIVTFVDGYRQRDMIRPPGLSELLDFAAALAVAADPVVSESAVRAAARTLVKDPDDLCVVDQVPIPPALLEP